MSWRVVVVTKHSKLSYKNGYLVVRSESLDMVHISEINVLVLESSMISISCILINELLKNKVEIIFCDERHNPVAEVTAFYGVHNSSKKIQNQIKWDDYYKKYVWTHIIKQKILNQAGLLHRKGFTQAVMLYDYSENLELYDETNREGHAAKVYFNALFGKSFSRDDQNDINAALDYGYSVLLANFNREIVINGYLTQLGIKHKNEYNAFNLSSDLMEPFRVVIDEFVYENIGKPFDQEYKYHLLDLLNLKVKYDEKEQYLTNAIQIYVKSVFKAIEEMAIEKLVLFYY